ncbi:hypothetical protein [Candidatus Planktophila dulcis]|uniref:hypothetical protein n=1 Tax=Candidatus Planktophila dulcis TaxID=1884914 RepID=UPI003CF07746
MFNSQKKIATIVLGLVLPILTALPSQAETFAFASSPLTNLDPAGSTVNGGFTKFPTTAGMYIQQCIAPVGATRPLTCSDTIQLWVSAAGGPGTVSPTGPISLKVSGSITGKTVTVDCTTTQCGLFFRLDHTAPTDTSEDKFLPMTFAKGATAPVLAADEITVTLNGKPLVRNVPSNLAYRADAKIVATSKSGLAITFTSLTPDCTYSNGTLTALKGKGQCALGYSTAGNATTAAATGNFPFILTPGNQKIIGLTKSIKKGGSKALPLETNFGSPITYKSLGKNCVVEGNLVNAKKSGSCTIKATADAKVDTWVALERTVVIPIK